MNKRIGFLMCVLCKEMRWMSESDWDLDMEVCSSGVGWD